MNNLTYLLTYEFLNKIRLGNICDGGYVLGDLDGNYDCYISAGVSDEESFSRDFIEKYNMNEQYRFAFDVTIKTYPYHYTNKITFIKRNIGKDRNSKTANLSHFIENFNNIFLKMDIEGSEYEWINYITQQQLQKFKQIVIEFHGINDDSWGTNYIDKIYCLNKLSNTHYLIHVHGNNFSKTTNSIPDVIELTYIRKDYFRDIPKLNTIKLPMENIDFPNNVAYEDYNLNFKPFVNI
jgi:FkbM family methyltransferase